MVVLLILFYFYIFGVRFEFGVFQKTNPFVSKGVLLTSKGFLSLVGFSYLTIRVLHKFCRMCTLQSVESLLGDYMEPISSSNGEN